MVDNNSNDIENEVQATESSFNADIPGEDVDKGLAGVELVGKRAEEKAAKPEEKPPSLFSRYLKLGSTKPAENKPTTNPDVPEQFLMRWSAPEFVQTHKPIGWYIGFGIFFIAMIALAVFTRQYLAIGVFVLMAITLFIYANRPPRVLQYQISNYGVYVGDKKYMYDNFDAYYETSDYGQTVLELVPNGRFGTLVSLPPAEHKLEQLEQTLGQMLPKVDNRENIIDKLFRKLRF